MVFCGGGVFFFVFLVNLLSKLDFQGKGCHHGVYPKIHPCG